MLRDESIMAALLAGEPPKQVAADFGISERQLRSIRADFDARPTGLSEEPMALLQRVISQYEMQLRSFEQMAYAHAERTPSVAVAAMRGATTVRDKLVEIYLAAGKLPRSLGLFRTEAELRQVGESMGETIGKLRSGEITAEQADERWTKLAHAVGAKSGRRADAEFRESAERQRALASP